jgi:hypothetical protein
MRTGQPQVSVLSHQHWFAYCVQSYVTHLVTHHVVWRSEDGRKVVGELRAGDTQHRPTVEAGTTTADMHDVAVSPMTPIALPGAQDIGLSPIFPFQLLLRRNTTGQSPSNALTPTLLHGVKPRLTPPSVKRRTTPPHAPVS